MPYLVSPYRFMMFYVELLSFKKELKPVLDFNPPTGLVTGMCFGVELNLRILSMDSARKVLRKSSLG